METILIVNGSGLLQKLIKERGMYDHGLAFGFSYFFDDRVVAVFNGPAEKKHWKNFKTFIKTGRSVVIECAKFETVEAWKWILPATVIKIVGNENKQQQQITAKHNMYNVTSAYNKLIEIL